MAASLDGKVNISENSGYPTLILFQQTMFKNCFLYMRIKILHP